MSLERIIKNLKLTLLELVLEGFNYKKYEGGGSTDNAEGLIHLWYQENGQWKVNYYMKNKK